MKLSKRKAIYPHDNYASFRMFAMQLFSLFVYTKVLITALSCFKFALKLGTHLVKCLMRNRSVERFGSGISSKAKRIRSMAASSVRHRPSRS